MSSIVTRWLAVVAVGAALAGLSHAQETSLQKWRTLAEQGDAEAQYELGVMYDVGTEVPENNSEAVRWYRLAAEQGYAPAQNDLGVMYTAGDGVPENDAEAVKWFRLAAEQGDADAQTNLGAMYSNGEGVPQNQEEAVKWFRLAAGQGHAQAQAYLGLIEAEEGRKLFEQGDRRAGLAIMARAAESIRDGGLLHTLGHLYEDSPEIEGHQAEAIRLFGLAATLGDRDSKGHYGEALVLGKTVPVDHYAGVTLLIEASKLGFKPASQMLSDIEAKQKAARECAESRVKDLGYTRHSSLSSTSGAVTDWYIVHSGSGDARRGDVLSIAGWYLGDWERRGQYSELSVSARGFTGMPTQWIDLSAGQVGVTRLAGVGDVPATSRAQNDAETVIASCRP